MIPHLSMLSLPSRVTTTSWFGAILRAPLHIGAVNALYRPMPNNLENRLQRGSFRAMRLENGSRTPLVPRKLSIVGLGSMSADKRNVNIEIRLLNIMQDLAERSKKSLDGYRDDISLLDKGMWYSSDLFTALKMTNQIERINELTENSAFFNGYLNPKFFEQVREDGKNSRSCFQVKDGIPAAEALRAIVTGFSICDCTMAYSVAFYGALLDILKDDKFNRLFQGHFKMIIGQPNTFCSPEALFTEQMKEGASKPTEKGYRNIKKGQHAYFEGLLNYHEKHPFGHWGGINTVCVDDTPGRQLFTGLGLNPEGESEEQINQKLLERYNDSPNVKLGLNKELEDKYEHCIFYAQLNEDDQRTLKDVMGFIDPSSVYKMDLIHRLLKANPEEVSSNFITKCTIPRETSVSIAHGL